MTSRTKRCLAYNLVLICWCLVMAGCIIPILPTKGAVAGRRENLGENILAFVVPGATTKEDVLMQLGEADNLWPDSRLQYYSVTEQGGVAVLSPYAVAGYHRRLWRTLIVEFDKAGYVTSAELRTESCPIVLGARTQKTCDLVQKTAIPRNRLKTDAP